MNQLKLQVIVSTSNASATKLLISNIHSCLVIHWRQGLGLDLYVITLYSFNQYVYYFYCFSYNLLIYINMKFPCNMDKFCAFKIIT